MKYKVGDKVKVREWEAMEKEFGLDRDGDIGIKPCFSKNMREYCGRIMTISHANRTDYHMDGNDWFWTDKMFEPVDNHKIVITTDGSEILARFYDGEKVIKTATAKCAPDDTFDFATGAKLAFERLMNNEKEKPLTFREKLKQEHPEKVKTWYGGGCYGCPSEYGYEEESYCAKKDGKASNCTECWDRVIPESVTEPSKVEPKYKVGDRVIIADTNLRELGREYEGEIGVIDEIDSSYEFPYGVLTPKYKQGGRLWCKVSGYAPESFEIGDRVKVVDTGKKFPIYEEWFDKNAPELKKKWTDTRNVENGSIGIVKAIAPHENIKYYGMLHAIELQDGRVCLIQWKGLEKVEFIPHLLSDDDFYGNIGEPTNYRDVIGRPLCVGDVVEHFYKDGHSYGDTVIVKTKLSYRNHGKKAFVMGIEMECDDKKGTTGDWKIFKKRSFEEVADGEKISGIKYVKEN
jgi:hypothetical protein